MATKRERAELNKHWLRKWLRGTPHFVIGGEDNPYLLRWFVIPRNSVFNIYLHKFLRSDDDRALHDHPWWFASLILKGGYYEHRQGGRRYRHAGSVALRRPETLHRVELVRHKSATIPMYGSKPWVICSEKRCWTLVFTGPKIRNWGFACPKGWIPWQKFTEGSANGAEVTNGCGEYA